MNVILPISIYPINVISQSRKVYKDYLSVDVRKGKKNIELSMTVLDGFNEQEQREIIGSFLNYILQSLAIEELNLKVEE